MRLALSNGPVIDTSSLSNESVISTRWGSVSSCIPRLLYQQGNSLNYSLNKGWVGAQWLVWILWNTEKLLALL